MSAVLMQFRWLAGKNNSIFEVRITTVSVKVKVYIQML